MLYKAFDFEEIVSGLVSFKIIHGKGVIDVDFPLIFQHVCTLLQIRDHLKKDLTSNLFPHNSCLLPIA